MSANNFLPFCNTDTGSNLESQTAYAADSSRTNGVAPGVANPLQANKVWRQSSAIISQIAQITSDRLGQDVLDDGNLTNLYTQLNAAFPPAASNFPKTYLRLTSGSGTYTVPYQFVVSTASATVGATYTNNTQTFTVRATIAGSTLITMIGTGAPTASGTLTKASGTGDATITFSAVSIAKRIYVELVGGGGAGGDQNSVPAFGAGGGAGGVLEFKVSSLASSYSYAVGAGGTSNPGGVGGNGNTTSFDVNSVGGGTGGGIGGGSGRGSAGGAGGSVTFSTLGTLINSATGSPGANGPAANIYGGSDAGGAGGSGPLGGGGSNGAAGTANTGGGGAGVHSGSGGGSGGSGYINITEEYV